MKSRVDLWKEERIEKNKKNVPTVAEVEHLDFNVPEWQDYVPEKYEDVNKTDPNFLIDVMKNTSVYSHDSIPFSMYQQVLYSTKWVMKLMVLSGDNVFFRYNYKGSGVRGCNVYKAQSSNNRDSVAWNCMTIGQEVFSKKVDGQDPNILVYSKLCGYTQPFQWCELRHLGAVDLFFACLADGEYVVLLVKRVGKPKKKEDEDEEDEDEEDEEDEDEEDEDEEDEDDEDEEDEDEEDEDDEDEDDADGSYFEKSIEIPRKKDVPVSKRTLEEQAAQMFIQSKDKFSCFSPVMQIE
jgi:hypothetical protein